MTLALALTVGIVAAAGAYLVLSRDVLRIVLGLIILSGAGNLLLLAAGRVGSNQPAVVPAGQQVLSGAANPLPQALLLTALVIGFMLACLGLVLAVLVAQLAGTDDADALRHAEPASGKEAA